MRSSLWIYCHLVVRDYSVGAPETSQEAKASEWTSEDWLNPRKVNETLYLRQTESCTLVQYEHNSNALEYSRSSVPVCLAFTSLHLLSAINK